MFYRPSAWSIYDMARLYEMWQVTGLRMVLKLQGLLEQCLLTDSQHSLLTGFTHVVRGIILSTLNNSSINHLQKNNLGFLYWENWQMWSKTTMETANSSASPCRFSPALIHWCWCNHSLLGGFIIVPSPLWYSIQENSGYYEIQSKF